MKIIQPRWILTKECRIAHEWSGCDFTGLWLIPEFGLSMFGLTGSHLYYDSSRSGHHVQEISHLTGYSTDLRKQILQALIDFIRRGWKSQSGTSSLCVSLVDFFPQSWSCTCVSQWQISFGNSGITVLNKDRKSSQKVSQFYVLCFVFPSTTWIESGIRLDLSCFAFFSGWFWTEWILRNPKWTLEMPWDYWSCSHSLFVP